MAVFNFLISGQVEFVKERLWTHELGSLDEGKIHRKPIVVTMKQRGGVLKLLSFVQFWITTSSKIDIDILTFDIGRWFGRPWTMLCIRYSHPGLGNTETVGIRGIRGGLGNTARNAPTFLETWAILNNVDVWKEHGVNYDCPLVIQLAMERPLLIIYFQPKTSI